jgi:hypothetical protein
MSVFAEELAAVLLEMDPREEHEGIEEQFYDRWGFDLGSLEELIGRLLPLMIVGHTPLTGTTMIGLGKDGLWLAKTEYSSGSMEGGR